MDILNKVMNIVIPPIALTLLLFFLLPYLFIKFFVSKAIRPVFSENVAGKVVLITGASSGIGEYLAYEYAKRGACLALVARREDKLIDVATTATMMGCDDVITICADVSKVDDCKRFVDETVDYYRRLDHLVNNAGIAPISMFENVPDVTKFVQAMDTNFWGSVYGTYFAIPHLKKRKGRIIGISSAAGDNWCLLVFLPTFVNWCLTAPRLSIYSASKQALISFYENVRAEIGDEVGITIVTPGLVESEMTHGKFLSREGRLEVDPEMRDVVISLTPLMPVKECAKTIVNSACQGDNYVTQPPWMRPIYYRRVFWPEILEWCSRVLLVPGPSAPETGTLSKKIYDLFPDIEQYLYPGTVHFPELNGDAEELFANHHGHEM